MHCLRSRCDSPRSIFPLFEEYLANPLSKAQSQYTDTPMPLIMNGRMKSFHGNARVCASGETRGAPVYASGRRLGLPEFVFFSLSSSVILLCSSDNHRVRCSVQSFPDSILSACASVCHPAPAPWSIPDRTVTYLARAKCRTLHLKLSTPPPPASSSETRTESIARRSILRVPIPTTLPAPMAPTTRGR